MPHCKVGADVNMKWNIHISTLKMDLMCMLCGADVDDVDLMCMLCGADVDDVDLMCMLCGGDVDDVDFTCMLCGGDVDDVDPQCGVSHVHIYTLDEF